MPSCDIIFAFPTKARFSWIKGCEGVDKSDLKALTAVCGYALASLQNELSNQQDSTANTILKDYNRLQQSAERIRREGLNFDEKEQLNQSAGPITAIKQGLKLHPKSRDGWQEDAYNELLWLVSTFVSPAHALLFLCVISKNRVKNLTAERRAKLVQSMKRNEHSLLCPIFQSKAAELGLCNDDVDPGSQPASKKRKNDHRGPSSTTNANAGVDSVSTMDMLKSQSFFSKSRLLPAPTECNISSLSSDPSKSAVAFQDNSELSLTFRERDRTSPVRKSALVVADHTENPDAVTRRTKLLDVRDSNRADFISDVDYMILLFQSLGVSKIPRILFERARSPQFRWTESGCQVQLTALQAGLDQQLIDLLLDDARLARTIHELNRLSKLSTPMTGPWYCSVDSSLSMELCQSLSEQIRGEWRVKLLNWICFVFPRDQFWEPQFSSNGKLLLPLLCLVLPGIVQRDMVAHIRSDAIEVLLAASKMGDLPSRQRTLNMAAGILRDQSPKYLWGTIAYEQSVLSRLQADFNHSENVIEEFCRRTGNLNNSGLNIRDFYHGLQPNSVSKRLNAIYGCLHVSHLENLVQCEKYNIAVDEVDDWTPLNPSAKELRVLSSKQVTVAKIFRSQGRFEDARTTLETCLRQNVNRIQVLCSLADAYCDLGLPKKAYAILAPEIETERNKARRGKPFRRLVISAIDAILGQYLYQDAARTIQEAVTIFNNLSNLDVSDELLHVRVLVASARIAHYESQFSEAMKRWEIALDHVQRYGSFAGEGFTYAVIHLSICLAHLESNNMTKGWESFQHAERILCRGMRDFWIPTFATRWYPDTRARIETLKGWALCKSAQKAA